MLWLCLHFPHLALEVFTRGSSSPELTVVCAGRQNRPLVFCCNARARKAGIGPGMSVPAAQALAPNLKLYVRDEKAEADALAGLAAWAGQFTSWVSLAAPCDVLLEVEGSIKLFGDLDRLIVRVEQALGDVGYRAGIACAPTALAACCFARAGIAARIADREQLAAQLAKLPIAVLHEAPDALAPLDSLGVRTLGECMRLPRDGLARRFGVDLLNALDRAFGRLPDARERFIAPDRFESKLEMASEIEQIEPLLFAANRLLNEMSGYLRARGAGVTRFDFLLQHAHHPATHIPIGLASASREAKHLQILLRERLARHALPQPVRALMLFAHDIRELAAQNLSWLPGAEQDRIAARHLIERLRARLGEDAVQGLSEYADHRPESAWLYREPDTAAAPDAQAAPSRPLWLLREARKIDALHGELQPRGPLTLRAGPERIESGWWDEGDIARDYFVASNRQGQTFWIYRERGSEDWFLHGIFS